MSEYELVIPDLFESFLAREPYENIGYEEVAEQSILWMSKLVLSLLLDDA